MNYWPKEQLRRYHSDIWLPSNISVMLNDFINQFNSIDMTLHAKFECKHDKKSVIPGITKSKLFDSSNTLVECYERINANGMPIGILQKCVIRVHNLSKLYDYTYTVAREGMIITAWATYKNDIHKLKQSWKKYYFPVELTEILKEQFEGKYEEEEYKSNSELVI